MNKVPYVRLIVIAFILISITSYIAALHLVPSIKSPQHLYKRERQALKTKRYYAVVVPLQSMRANITRSELSHMVNSGKVAVALKDAAALSQLIHVDLHATAQNRPRVVSSSDGIAILRIDDLTPNVRVCTVDGKSLWDNTSYPLYATVQKTGSETEFDRSKVIRMTAVGRYHLRKNSVQENDYVRVCKPICKRCH